MKNTPGLLFAATLFTTACGGGAATDVQPTPVTGDSARVALYDAHLDIGTSRIEVRRNLGQPDSVIGMTRPNRHGAGTDSVISYGYGKWTFEFLRTENGQEFLTGAETTDSTHPLPGDIRIGRTDVQQLLVRLGEPELVTRHGDTTLHNYPRPGEAANSTLQVKLVADTVRSIRWIPYVD